MTAAPAVIEHNTCRVCGSGEMVTLFGLGNHYVSNFVTREVVEAGYPDCPRCPLELELCRGCTCVQLRHTAPQELLYSRKYWYKSGVSQTMRNALKDVAMAAERLVDLEDGDVVLDIGSNDGTLLRCFRPGLVRVGVEPADNLATPDNYEGLVLVHDFWPSKTDPQGRLAKVISALGMFYDLEDPPAFIKGVADALHPEGVFIAQLMCLRQTLESNDVGNVCHEHLEYYSLKSLVAMYGRAGLEIFDVEQNTVNGGSYRLYARHKGAAVGAAAEAFGRVDQALFHEAEMRLDKPATYFEWYQRLLANAHEVKKLVYREVRGGRNVYAYGASTKGNTLLQWLGLDHTAVRAVADKDPAKWGLYTVGTGIPVISKEAFRQSAPDFALVLPYAFKAEMVEEERGQRWRERGGKLVFVLPRLEVV